MTSVFLDRRQNLFRTKLPFDRCSACNEVMLDTFCFTKGLRTTRLIDESDKISAERTCFDGIYEVSLPDDQSLVALIASALTTLKYSQKLYTHQRVIVEDSKPYSLHSTSWVFASCSENRRQIGERAPQFN